MIGRHCTKHEKTRIKEGNMPTNKFERLPDSKKVNIVNAGMEELRKNDADENVHLSGEGGWKC